MSQVRDLTGFEGDYMKVICKTNKPIDAKRNCAWWRCLCVCGREFTASKINIVNGHSKSCGCEYLRNKRGSSHHMWKGYGEISSSYWKGVIHGAKSRNFSFNITIEYAWDLFLKQNRKCALSGIDLYFNPHTKISTGNASLDRIDSKLGYEVENIQWIEKRINVMKMDMCEEEFISLCNKISSHNGTK